MFARQASVTIASCTRNLKARKSTCRSNLTTEHVSPFRTHELYLSTSKHSNSELYLSTSKHSNSELYLGTSKHSNSEHYIEKLERNTRHEDWRHQGFSRVSRAERLRCFMGLLKSKGESLPYAKHQAHKENLTIGIHPLRAFHLL